MSQYTNCACCKYYIKETAQENGSKTTPPKKPVISAKFAFAQTILKFAPTLFLLHRKIELVTEVRVLYKNNILKQKNVHTVDKRKCSV